MTFTIPNESAAAFADQAEPDSRDFLDILAPGSNLHGVQSGAAVSAQGTPDMTVAVAVGVVRHGGRRVAVTAGNVTITAADATNPRFDLITVDATGTKVAVTGTPDANPVFPDPTGDVVLAAVYVPANDTEINSNQIIDKRILLQAPPHEDIRWYGAAVDGATDDRQAILDAITAAVAEGSRSVHLPGGSIAVTDTISITDDGVQLLGRGSGMEQNNASQSQWNPATELLRTGATTTPMITFTGPIQGVRVQGIGLDGGAVALKGLEGDQLQFSAIVDVGVRNLDAATGIALDLFTTSGTADINSHHNLISKFAAEAPTIIRLDGNAGGDANCAMNLFERISGIYGDATNNSIGIILNDCDNNVFTNVWLFRAAGTGVGFNFGADARGNVCFHLAAQNGVNAATPTVATYQNAIYGLDRGNGAPQPTLQSGARLSWTEEGNNAAGWYTRGFGRSILVGDMAAGDEPGFLNSGKGIHVVDDAGTPEIRLEATANSQSAACEMESKGGAGEARRGRVISRPDGELSLENVTAGYLGFRTVAARRGRVTGAGSWILTESALATTATDGFVYLPEMAGVPTGTPTTVAGTPFVYDTTNDLLWRWNGSEWEVVGLERINANFGEAGTLAVVTGAFRWYNDTGRTLTFLSARASVGTAPAGADILVDVNVNGTTVFSTQTNRPTISAGTNTGETTTFNTTTIADGSYLTVDIDQVGSTTEGADLTVQIWMRG